MIITLAQAAFQQPAMQTPDTVRSMIAGYTAIGVVLVGYILYLWTRYRKLKY